LCVYEFGFSSLPLISMLMLCCCWKNTLIHTQNGGCYEAKL
jgi:hypothetical protein